MSSLKLSWRMVLMVMYSQKALMQIMLHDGIVTFVIFLSLPLIWIFTLEVRNIKIVTNMPHFLLLYFPGWLKVLTLWKVGILIFFINVVMNSLIIRGYSIPNFCCEMCYN